MEEIAAPEAKEGFRQSALWKKVVKPAVLAFVFQYAYMAYYIGLRVAMGLAIIDGFLLLSMDKSQEGYFQFWIIKSLVEWPILGLLGANGLLDKLSGPDRTGRDRVIDAVMMGGLVIVVTANILLLIHKIL